MKVLAFLLCCVLVAQANVLKYKTLKQWEQFKVDHGKAYGNEMEHDFRYKIFVENLQRIAEHNKKFEEGKSTFKLGVNKFADLLSSEFSEMYLNRGTSAHDNGKYARLADSDLPDSVDWRTKGAVTEVKDQGSCGGCWSFAGTGALEGQHFLSTGELVSLSEQNLMDCSKDYGNMGCFGGLEYYGYQYIADNGGIDTEESYPYEAKNGPCRFDAANVGATDTGYLKTTKNDEEELKNVVATIGPISVGIDAEWSFQLYESGILKTSDCSSRSLNHSVLVVGYGTEDGQDYWLVKNSWGASYGEDGYIRMARNYNNMCGIAADTSYPTV